MPLANKKLILASSSPYRKQLLSKFLLPFTCISPDIDETPLANELAHNLVMRLAKQKAQAIGKLEKNAIIIASDQVCVIDGKIVGKPLNRATAISQLTRASGQSLTFYTSLCVYDSQSEFNCCDYETCLVTFRQLSDLEIEFYVDKEQPFHCAGSFKSEGLGISLFTKIESRDPNTLIGLPLILLNQMLKSHGVNVLSK